MCSVYFPYSKEIWDQASQDLKADNTLFALGKISLGKIEDIVAHFVFILFLQTSCMMSGEQGHTKSSKEGELRKSS